LALVWFDFLTALEGKVQILKYIETKVLILRHQVLAVSRTKIQARLACVRQYRGHLENITPSEN
jgi:hypothetical protein